MKKRYFTITLVLLLIFVLIFAKQISTNLKILLFISEEFPQVPIKPLGLLTAKPEHKKVEFETSNGKVVTDLYMPDQDKAAALIVAMGIKTQEKDKPLILKFMNTMTRLGYVTFWPRLEALDQGESLPEDPQTFVKAFDYLAELPVADKSRISYMGFSVGSSTAFVAASDPNIRDKVHGLIFFGGQFDIFDYFLSLASKSYEVDGQRISWNVADDARNHAKGLLLTKQAEGLVKIFDQETLVEMKMIIEQVSKEEKEKLAKYNPQEFINQFRARAFILHDKSDTYVPYVESIKLYQALPKEQIGAFVITDLFDHVQPNRPISAQNLVEIFKLYGFLYKVLIFL